MDSLDVGLKILELNNRLGKLTDEIINISREMNNIGKELLNLTDDLLGDAANETQVNKGGKNLILHGKSIKFPKLEAFCLKYNINWKIDNAEDIRNDTIVTFRFVKDGYGSVVRRYIINSKSESILVGNRLIFELCEEGFKND